MRASRSTSEFLSQPGHGNIKLFAVFGDCTPGDVVTLLVEYFLKLIIGVRLTLVFRINDLFDDLLDFTAAHLFARIGGEDFREEIFERINSEIRLQRLAASHP